MKDIAQEAGVATGLLHYYFGSKEDLLLEVVRVMDEEMTSDWHQATEGIDDPLERIARGVDHAAKTCGSEPEFYRILIDLYALGLSNPAIRERSAELLQGFIGELAAECLRISEGLPTPLPFDPAALARCVAGAMDGVALTGLVLGEDATTSYQALKVLLLSFASFSYIMAGQQPPLERILPLMQPAE